MTDYMQNHHSGTKAGKYITSNSKTFFFVYLATKRKKSCPFL